VSLMMKKRSLAQGHDTEGLSHRFIQKKVSLNDPSVIRMLTVRSLGLSVVSRIMVREQKARIRANYDNTVSNQSKWYFQL